MAHLPDTAETTVSALLAQQVNAGHCPGALAHVERAGQVLARHAVGLVGPDTGAAMHDGVRFRVASLTKPVVTVAALMLVDEGRLELDAPVASSLPELQDLRLVGGQRPARAPTVRDLMRHTSGLAYPHEINDAALRAAWASAGFAPAMSGLDEAAFLARLARLPLVAEPGSAFRYGYSTDVLGCVVARLAGEPLGAVLKRRIFTPLGMLNTGFQVSADMPDDLLASALPCDTAWHATVPAIGRRAPGQPGMDSGGGGLVSTLDDYAAFARWLAGGARGAGGSRGAGKPESSSPALLSADLMAELARNQLPPGVDGPANYCGPGFGFGLGLAVRHDWGPAAMPCHAGELCWSGISGTAMFVHPPTRWFALLFSANMASRMVCRLAFRWAAARL